MPPAAPPRELDGTWFAASVPMASIPRATSQVADVLDRLARLEPSDVPVLSLYLNLQANKHGKDDYEAFLRKELSMRGRTFPPRSDARQSYDQDAARIQQWLADELPASANGLALFASAARGLFEAVVLEAPIASHRLSVAPEPHLYPLELLLNQHPPCAVVVADSHAARIFVFALGRTVAGDFVPGERINRTMVGGWSQLRYQRHSDELRAQHVRELVARLEGVVRDEGVDAIVIAGDGVQVPLVTKELPPALVSKVVDVVAMDARTPEHDVMKAASEALGRHDARTDVEAVDRVLGDYRAGNLAVVGLDDTRQALEVGQVDELLLTAASPAPDPGRTNLDELVARARQTGARVRMIEDASLLASVGGVAAALRYRRDGRPLGKGRSYEQTD
jgi:peptide subunit release factor 1 (eRF1)